MRFTKNQTDHLYLSISPRIEKIEDIHECKLLSKLLAKIVRKDNPKLYQDEKEYLISFIPSWINTYEECQDFERVKYLNEVLKVLLSGNLLKRKKGFK